MFKIKIINGMDSDLIIALNAALFFSALGAFFCFALDRENSIPLIVAGFLIHAFAGAAINLLFVFNGKSVGSWYLMLSPLMLSFGIPGSDGRMEHVENGRNDWILAGCLSIFICIWIALSSKMFLKACIGYGATTEIALILNIILGGTFIVLVSYFGNKVREIKKYD